MAGTVTGATLGAGRYANPQQRAIRTRQCDKKDPGVEIRRHEKGPDAGISKEYEGTKDQRTKKEKLRTTQYRKQGMQTWWASRVRKQSY